MKEVRIHARAGQGAITTAAILGQALFLKGKYAYAFPSFGAARMGAPMNAFVRIDNNPIRLRSQVYNPDYLIIADATLMRGFNCFAGFKDDGIAIINEREDIEIPKPQGRQKIFALPANNIAIETIGRPIGNTVLIGAFAAATGEFGLEELSQAINKRFSGKIAQGNLEAAKRGFEFIKNLRK